MRVNIYKEKEMQRASKDITGRQALLMVRDYYRESRSDREHTDRLKVDGTRLKGDDVEGFWSSMQVTLAEIAPNNMPGDSYLLHHMLTQLRGSQRFSQAVDMWDMVLPPERRTYMELQHMIQDFIKRDHERTTTMMIRNEVIGLPAHTGLTIGKGKGKQTEDICFGWKKTGVCPRPDTCKYKHPSNQKGSVSQQDHSSTWSEWKQWSNNAGGAGGAQQRGRGDRAASKTRGPSTDPKKVCTMYTKGLCKKSHTECPMIHNPTCWHFSQNHKCLKGDKCLFPHRDPNKSGQFVNRSDDVQAPADRGGQPQANAQGDTKANNGKNKKDDLAKHGVFQRLGEPVISSSPEANATAQGLSSGLPSGVHPSVFSGAPNGLDESRSMPKQTAMRQSAARK